MIYWTEQMTIKEIYEKYKHMDKIIDDKFWLSSGAYEKVIYEFWQAIKAQNKQQCFCTCCQHYYHAVPYEYESILAAFIAALGWQGGTLEAALAEIKRLRLKELETI